MPKHELAICVVDEPDHRADTKRKKEGDIVAIRPHPWNWGRKEIDEYLIVIIETNNFEALEFMISQQVYRDKVNSKVVSETQYENLTDFDSGTRNSNEFEMYAKRRLSISLANIKTSLTDLDLTKTRDKKKIYQPFKSAAQLAQKFDGQNGNRLLGAGDCDCVSSVADSSTEFSVNLDVIPAVIYDKFHGELIKP